MRSWRRYDAGLRTPPTTLPGLSADRVARLRAAYYLSVNVVKASEDKTFPGAIAAGLASPWGQAVSAGTLQDGKAPYFGSYRDVFGRDLYEAFTALLTAGDRATRRPPRASCSSASSCRTGGCRATACSTARPRPTPANSGSGHLWPVLVGERAEQQVQTGQLSRAADLLDTIDRSASGVGLVPEQVWEDPAVPASPFGTDPAPPLSASCPGTRPAPLRR